MNRGLFAAISAFLCAAGMAFGQDAPAGAVTAPEVLLTESPFFQDTGPRYMVWGSAEYVLWRISNAPLATPLVTTSVKPNEFDANGNNLAATLVSPNTRVLFGSDDLNYNWISGGKLALGSWLNYENTIGVEARGFFLGRQSFERSFASGPAGLPVVGIPVNVAIPVNSPIVAIAPGPNAIVSSFPLLPFPGGGTFGGFVGSATVAAQVQLWGTELNGVWNCLRTDRCNLDLLAGFRYANLTENVSLTSASSNLVSAANFGGVAFLNNFFDGTIVSSDSWQTKNQFYGGQIGFKAETRFGRAFLNVSGQIALGATHQTLNIQGVTTLVTTTGQTAQAVGGTFATQNNIGNYSRDPFSVIPELEFKLGYNLTERLRVYAGYNLLYWTNVARAGQQIDPNVDLRQVPTIPAYDPTLRNTLPAPQIHNSNLTLQGIVFGLEYRF